jgi:hypothetical protein
MAFREIKQKGVLLYLRTLSMVRKSLLFGLLVFCVFQMMVLGFIGAVVSGIWLLPIEDQVIRLWILFGVFASFFIIPFLVLLVLLSEKVWYKASGAEDLLR